MPHVTITENADEGITRCILFLLEKNIPAAKKAAKLIDLRLKALKKTPDMGRPHPIYHELRELLIEFGASGYMALYHHAEADDAVYVLAFRHQKEAGYSWN